MFPGDNLKVSKDKLHSTGWADGLRSICIMNFIKFTDTGTHFILFILSLKLTNLQNLHIQ